MHVTRLCTRSYIVQSPAIQRAIIPPSRGIQSTIIERVHAMYRTAGPKSFYILGFSSANELNQQPLTLLNEYGDRQTHPD
jgi:hypothetical protein